MTRRRRKKKTMMTSRIEMGSSMIPCVRGDDASAESGLRTTTTTTTARRRMKMSCASPSERHCGGGPASPHCA
jgi:hypothetical protein